MHMVMNTKTTLTNTNNTNDTTLYSKCNQASDLWQQLELASKLESNL